MNVYAFVFCSLLSVEKYEAKDAEFSECDCHCRMKEPQIYLLRQILGWFIIPWKTPQWVRKVKCISKFTTFVLHLVSVENWYQQSAELEHEWDQ